MIPCNKTIDMKMQFMKYDAFFFIPDVNFCFMFVFVIESAGDYATVPFTATGEVWQQFYVLLSFAHVQRRQHSLCECGHTCGKAFFSVWLEIGTRVSITKYYSYNIIIII